MSKNEISFLSNNQFAELRIELFFQPYTDTPNWASGGKNEIAFIPTVSVGAFNQVDLTSFSNWHTSNASSIYVTYITNRYFYTFDGGANNITDGGSDMYDGGNYISLSTVRGSTNLLNSQSNNYGTLSNFTSQNYGFFISQANVWPQISLAYTNSGTVQWRINGNVGTDGGGSNSNFSGTYTTTNQGRYGSFWVNQNYGGGDPTICMTWFSILQSNLDSAITSCNDNRQPTGPPPNEMNQNFTVTGSNYLFGCFLLSRSNGVLIPSTDIQNFLSNYVTNANIIIT